VYTTLSQVEGDEALVENYVGGADASHKKPAQTP
jgi:hypothetical protein